MINKIILLGIFILENDILRCITEYHYLIHVILNFIHINVLTPLHKTLCFTEKYILLNNFQSYYLFSILQITSCLLFFTFSIDCCAVFQSAQTTPMFLKLSDIFSTIKQSNVLYLNLTVVIQ